MQLALLFFLSLFAGLVSCVSTLRIKIQEHTAAIIAYLIKFLGNILSLFCRHFSTCHWWLNGTELGTDVYLVEKQLKIVRSTKKLNWISSWKVAKKLLLSSNLGSFIGQRKSLSNHELDDLCPTNISSSEGTNTGQLYSVLHCKHQNNTILIHNALENRLHNIIEMTNNLRIHKLHQNSDLHSTLYILNASSSGATTRESLDSFSSFMCVSVSPLMFN